MSLLSPKKKRRGQSTCQDTIIIEQFLFQGGGGSAISEERGVKFVDPIFKKKSKKKMVVF
jgi:hypothetical protein